MGRTMEVGCGPSVFLGFFGCPERILGVVEDLEELHGVRVQSDDRVVIIRGFVILQLVP